MPTATPSYIAASTLTITLGSLANSASASGVGRQSTAIDNSSALGMDAHVGGKIVTGTTTAGSSVEIWAFGSYDGTSYSGGAGTTDASLTLLPAIRMLLKPLTIIAIPDTTSRTYTWGPISVAQAFGGVMPVKWGVWVLNSSGAALSASGHEVKYTPIKFASA